MNIKSKNSLYIVLLLILLALFSVRVIQQKDIKQGKSKNDQSWLPELIACNYWLCEKYGTLGTTIEQEFLRNPILEDANGEIYTGRPNVTKYTRYNIDTATFFDFYFDDKKILRTVSLYGKYDFFESERMPLNSSLKEMIELIGNPDYVRVNQYVQTDHYSLDFFYNQGIILSVLIFKESPYYDMGEICNLDLDWEIPINIIHFVYPPDTPENMLDYSYGFYDSQIEEQSLSEIIISIPDDASIIYVTKPEYLGCKFN